MYKQDWKRTDSKLRRAIRNGQIERREGDMLLRQHRGTFTMGSGAWIARGLAELRRARFLRAQGSPSWLQWLQAGREDLEDYARVDLP